MILSESMDKIPAGLHLEYLEDKDRKLHIKDILVDEAGKKITMALLQ